VVGPLLRVLPVLFHYFLFCIHLNGSEVTGQIYAIRGDTEVIKVVQEIVAILSAVRVPWIGPKVEVSIPQA
jgi:hypothetical protein